MKFQNNGRNTGSFEIPLEIPLDYRLQNRTVHQINYLLIVRINAFLKVAESVPVQHVLYTVHSVVPSIQTTQFRVDPARFMQQM